MPEEKTFQLERNRFVYGFGIGLSVGLSENHDKYGIYGMAVSLCHYITTSKLNLASSIFFFSYFRKQYS